VSVRACEWASAAMVQRRGGHCVYGDLCASLFSRPQNVVPCSRGRRQGMQQSVSMCARPHWRPCLAALLPHSWLLTQTGRRFWLKARIPSGRLAPRKRRRTSDSSLCRPIASTTLGVASASSATCCGPGTPQCQQRPGLGPWRSRSGRGCTLLARIESGEHSRMVAASSSARAARRACGTTSVTKPRRSPSAAVTSRPVRIKPIARWMPGPRTPTPPPKCTHAHVHAQTRTRTRIIRRTLAAAKRGICVLSWSGSRSDGCARARCIGDEGERAVAAGTDR
jgi:hypothetical protein